MPVLKLENVSIRYKTGDFRSIGLKETIIRKIKGTYRVSEFWANQNISFSIEKGDILGIIGANGAGKSTLLKAIAGIMKPSGGTIEVNGNIAALLEIASGFDPDLSIKQNAYLRGAMLGYTREFMDEKYEEILEFAELKEFQDLSFKQLSTGMQSRLAFSIASLVNPDILILDEVLSVGDGSFAIKSAAKMLEIIKNGATTIMVSHSIDQIRKLCNKVLWLHKGRQIDFGETESICDRYCDFLNGKLSVLDNEKEKADCEIIKSSTYFDEDYYRKTYCIDKNEDAAIHYFKKGFLLGYNPSAKFDNDFYFEKNTDVLFANVNPLVHYETFGKKEQRQISEVHEYKHEHHKPEKSNILLITHELSLSGAPLVLFNMAKILKSHSIEPIILSPEYGYLEEELKANQIQYLVEPYLLTRLYRKNEKLERFLSSFSTILFNTIISLKYINYINTKNRKICWIHEGKCGYGNAEGIFNVKQAFEKIDEVYSVGEYAKSFTDKYVQPEKSKILLYGLENIKLTSSHLENKKLTFGFFGVCCERKGTDLFVQSVKSLPENLKRDCCFKIIGKLDDSEFCKQLKQVAENENIIFTGQLSHSDTLKEMENTDVIVCPSRDDPMPIVCTEAMQLNKPVICSDHAGTASFIEDSMNGFIYKLNDDKLEDIIAKVYEKRDKLSIIGKEWHKIYKEKFTKSTFEKNILDLLAKK